jgi:molecular chaperone GrpE (heat shock protein)
MDEKRVITQADVGKLAVVVEDHGGARAAPPPAQMAQAAPATHQAAPGSPPPAAPAPNKSPRADALKAELEAERDALLRELAPHREYYERHQADQRFIQARQKIKEISAKLGPVQNELAALARASGARSIKAEAGTYTRPQGGQ